MDPNWIEGIISLVALIVLAIVTKPWWRRQG